MEEEGYGKWIFKCHCVIVQSTETKVRQNVRVTSCLSATNVFFSFSFRLAFRVFSDRMLYVAGNGSRVV